MQIAPASVKNNNPNFQAQLRLKGDYTKLTNIEKLVERAKLIGNEADTVEIHLGPVKLLDKKMHEVVHPAPNSGVSVYRTVGYNATVGDTQIIKAERHSEPFEYSENLVDGYPIINKILRGLHKKFPGYTASPNESLQQLKESRVDVIKSLAAYLYGQIKQIPENVKQYLNCAYTVNLAIKQKALPVQNDIKALGKAECHYDMAPYTVAEELIDRARHAIVGQYMDARKTPEVLQEFDRKAANVRVYTLDKYYFAEKPNYVE